MRKFHGPVMGSLMGSGTGGGFELNTVLRQLILNYI